MAFIGTNVCLADIGLLGDFLRLHEGIDSRLTLLESVGSA